MIRTSLSPTSFARPADQPTPSRGSQGSCLAWAAAMPNIEGFPGICRLEEEPQGPNTRAFEFVVPDFDESAKKGGAWQSANFWYYGYRWRLGIYPHGNGDGKGTHVSAFLLRVGAKEALAGQDCTVVYQFGFGDDCKRCDSQITQKCEAGSGGLGRQKMVSLEEVRKAIAWPSKGHLLLRIEMLSCDRQGPGLQLASVEVPVRE